MIQWLHDNRDGIIFTILCMFVFVDLLYDWKERKEKK